MLGKRYLACLMAILLAGAATDAMGQYFKAQWTINYYEMLVSPDVDGRPGYWSRKGTEYNPCRIWGDGFGDKAAGDFDAPINAGLQGDGTARFVDTGANGSDGFAAFWNGARGSIYMRVKVNAGPTGTPGAYTMFVRTGDPSIGIAIALDTDGIRLINQSGTVLGSWSGALNDDWHILRIQVDNRTAITGLTGNYCRVFVDSVSDRTPDEADINWTLMNVNPNNAYYGDDAPIDANWTGFWQLMGADANVTGCDILVDWIRVTGSDDNLVPGEGDLSGAHPHGLHPPQEYRLWDKPCDHFVYPHYVTNMTMEEGGTAASPEKVKFQIINTSYNNPNTMPYTVIECDSAGNPTDHAWLKLVDGVGAAKSGGTLSAAQGSLDTVYATLDSGASALAPGTYSAYIKFTESCTAPVVPGIKVSNIYGLETNEMGFTTSFTVVLKSQPTADVVIGISSSNLSEGTVDKSSLTFTSSDWSTPQTVTITGVDDGNATDGPQWYTIVTAPAVSADANYNGMDADDVLVRNNDKQPGITISPMYELETSENGGTAQVKAMLNTSPVSGTGYYVRIRFDWFGDKSEVALSAEDLYFTAANWTTPQILTLTGLDDSWDDGDIIVYQDRLATASGGYTDPNYHGKQWYERWLTITNLDNDPTIRRIDLVVKDPDLYQVWEYCGDVPPIEADSAGPGLRFRKWGMDNSGVPVGGKNSGTVEDENSFVDGTVVTDPDAWNGKAFRIYDAVADADNRCMYQSDDNAGTNDVAGVPQLNKYVGGTAVARLKVVDSTGYAVNRKLGLFVTGPAYEWPEATTKNMADTWASIAYRSVQDDNVVLDGFRRNVGFLDGDKVVDGSQDYHILRVAVVAGNNDNYQDDQIDGNGRGNAVPRFNTYGRRVTMWYDEGATPVVDVVNTIQASEAHNYTGNYNGFKFGVYDRNITYDIYYDWVTFTNAGAFGPGEENAVIGRSLVPTSTRCQPCNAILPPDADKDGDVDQDDFAQFQACYSADQNYPTELGNCNCFDSDGSGKIDADDFAAFTACATGPGIPVNLTTAPDCPNLLLDSWEANSGSLGHLCGSLLAPDDWRCTTDLTPLPCYMSYGPYVRTPVGNYVARFHLAIDDISGDDDDICVLDVFDADDHVQLAAIVVTRLDFTAANEWQAFDVPFVSSVANHRAEFRVQYSGNAQLDLDKIELLRQ